MRQMEIRNYFRGQRRQLDRSSGVVKDASVFDFNYIPDQPLMREECKPLIDNMLSFEVRGFSDHLAVFGGRGCGKTLTVKYLKQVIEAETELKMLYANCRHHNTSFKIFAHLLGVQARGCSLTELYERFCCTYPGKTVVVLDEVDLMSPKDRNREILYFLSRSETPFMVVMLSNNPRVLKELDPATMSSLQPVPVYFRNYNAQQIQEILRDRAEKGLRTWDKGQLAQIAALTTKLTNADARVAIKALQYTVTSPEEELRVCFERARRDIVIDLVNDLPDANLLMLEAVASSRSAFAKDVYHRYCALSQAHGEKPFSYVYFYSNLSYLQSLGLVALVAAKIGKTHTNRLLLTFEQPVLQQIYQLRFQV